MNTRGIDHLCIEIPADGIDEFVELYRDTLGFEIESLDAYRTDEREYFCLRLTDKSFLQISPTAGFTPARDTGFDHLALAVDMPQSEILDRLDDSELHIRTVIRDRVGATGKRPAVYFDDPFGYTVELRSTAKN